MPNETVADDPQGDPSIGRGIAEARERFEGAWREGRRPRLEDHLTEASGPVRPVLLRELLTVELTHRRLSGEHPEAEEYRGRFPDYPEVVEETLEIRGPGDPALDATQAEPSDGPRAENWPEVPGYEILDVLGRGGMGVVYRAKQLHLDRICALKAISAEGSGGDEAAHRFLAEAKALAAVRHPNVVQIYHAGEHDGGLFFEMEYVEGGSLAHRLLGVPWSPSRAARLIDSVARAVDEVHHHRIVHRDLKPANILLTADGTPKVADFGLAKRIDPGANLTLVGVILGTPSYMAPEQAKGMTNAIGVATDVYALGAILYELLTGEPPFRGKSKLDLLDKIKTAEPAPPSRVAPGIPADLDAVCLKCLRKEPAERYETAVDLAEDLRRFLNGEPTLARPTAVPKREEPRRSPLVPILSGLAVVVSLACLAILLYGRPGRDKEEAPKPEPNAFGVPYVIQPGEYPMSIAARMLGDGRRWKEIRKDDGQFLTDEDAKNLVPGQTLYLPTNRTPPGGDAPGGTTGTP